MAGVKGGSSNNDDDAAHAAPHGAASRTSTADSSMLPSASAQVSAQVSAHVSAQPSGAFRPVTKGRALDYLAESKHKYDVGDADLSDDGADTSVMPSLAAKFMGASESVTRMLESPVALSRRRNPGPAEEDMKELVEEEETGKPLVEIQRDRMIIGGDMVQVKDESAEFLQGRASEGYEHLMLPPDSEAYRWTTSSLAIPGENRSPASISALVPLDGGLPRVSRSTTPGAKTTFSDQMDEVVVSKRTQYKRGLKQATKEWHKAAKKATEARLNTSRLSMGRRKTSRSTAASKTSRSVPGIPRHGSSSSLGRSTSERDFRPATAPDSFSASSRDHPATPTTPGRVPKISASATIADINKRKDVRDMARRVIAADKLMETLIGRVNMLEDERQEWQRLFRQESTLRTEVQDQARKIAELEEKLQSAQHANDRLSTLVHQSKVSRRMAGVSIRRWKAVYGEEMAARPPNELEKEISALTATIDESKTREAAQMDEILRLRSRVTELEEEVSRLQNTEESGEAQPTGRSTGSRRSRPRTGRLTPGGRGTATPTIRRAKAAAMRVRGFSPAHRSSTPGNASPASSTSPSPPTLTSLPTKGTT